MSDEYPERSNHPDNRPLDRLALLKVAVAGGAVMLFSIGIAGFLLYRECRIYVGPGEYGILIKKTGKDLQPGEEVAPSEEYKGLQLAVLSDGHHNWYNPYTWEWRVYPMVDVPAEKMGVRIRLYGEDLPYGDFLATQENQKGIVPEVLKAGRVALNAVLKGDEGSRPNDFVEIIELHDPVTIPAGFKGVVTNLAGPLADDPNTLLVPVGRRGVQADTLEPGTYYMNPYMYRIDAVDCRSQRFNLAENDEMGFPSKDGFWVSLDGIIEFHVKPEKAAEAFVVYNELSNDDGEQNSIGQEIIRKVIMPNARSFCRLRGSNSSGRDLIGGQTRTAFQAAFQEAIRETCDKQGIAVVHALITKINPPQAIALPVRNREVAHQQLKQFQQQRLQQEAEAKLAIEKALIEQRQALVEVDRKVVEKVVKAKEEQQVAITKAKELLEVARRKLQAAQDESQAMLARARADARIVELQNEAEAAGWKRAVQALGGDGEAYARYVLYQKLAPGFRQIMSNTADSPLMAVFRDFADRPTLADKKGVPPVASVLPVADPPADAKRIAADSPVTGQ